MEILICFNLGLFSHVFCPSDQWEQQPLKLVQHWELQWCNRLHVVPTGNCPLGSVWYWLLKATENFFSLPLTRRRYCDQDLLESCSEISWNLFHIVTENLFDHTKALFPPSSTVQFSSAVFLFLMWKVVDGTNGRVQYRPHFGLPSVGVPDTQIWY